MTERKLIRVLFVCLGNICRSPMAEAVFRRLVDEAGLSDQIDAASAGTDGWHAGEPPHPGTLRILEQNHISIGRKKAHQLTRSDVKDFDYIIAMDQENAEDVLALFGKRIPRLLEFVPGSTIQDVPDPYYSGGFDTVYQLIKTGSQALLDYIRQKENL